MSAIGKSTPILVTVMLIAGGLACRKPEAVQPEKSKVAVNPAQDNSKAEDAARRQAEAERQRKQDEAVEAARKATALSEAAYQKATEAALKDVHFGFDKSDIQESDKTILVAIADFLKTYPQANLIIDGNCDERGTVEYNLALGEHRAHAAMDYLVSLGVPAARLTSTSYGKEKPVCTEATESCWGKNRRAHFAIKK